MVAAEVLSGPEADSLAHRMMNLVRLSVVVGPTHPRRALLDAILRRMRQFARMTEKLGLAPPKSVFAWAVLREAELDCMECREWQRCRHWLDGRAPGDEPNAFCPNHALFASLPREDGGQPLHDPKA